MEIAKDIAKNDSYRIFSLNSSESARNDSVEMTITLSVSQQDTNQSLRDFTEYKIAEFMEDHYRYFVSAVGIPGNIACIVTLIFMKLKLSSYLFMLALAITDLTAILLILAYRLLDENNIRLGDRFCQVIFFAGTTSQMYPNWILVAMTTERFIAVKFPFKFKTICVKKNAVFVIVLLLVSIISVNTQFLFTFKAENGPFPCGPKEKYNDFLRFVWYWIDGSLYAIIPISVILILNSLIIYSIRNSRKTLAARGRSSREMTRMLLTTTIVFVLLVLPNCLFFICRGYWNWRKTSYSAAQYHLVYQVVFMLSDLNHAINFYLYCLSGRNFREQFLQILCLRGRGRPTRPSRPSRTL